MTKVRFSRNPAENSAAIESVLLDVERTHGAYCTPAIRAVVTDAGIRLFVTLVHTKDAEAPNARVGELEIQPGLHDSEVVARDVRELLGEFFADDNSRV